ncbi:hypothetical protein [Rhodoblastus acidophilus]|uniref:hypothetical protein n=1 Tax=Rhodoblastus acidophilus TaxID=1074 RepID=UPI000B510EEF|nr:hypothetical protein [Rhodoblastus acidophilus]PPQ34970.1 hypothetical protein CKO16_21405 [Rhodoblastus acidophilus]RAI16814.1 hypothetical protein CH337_19445 [Rhodoblastus acidophilus]
MTMPRIQINPSRHGTPGEVVAVEDGLIVWAGPISALREAGSFDALFCHDDDEERLSRLMRGITPTPVASIVDENQRIRGG